MKGAIIARIHDKYWEAKCFAKIARQTLPDLDVYIATNAPDKRLDNAEAPVINIAPPNEEQIAQTGGDKFQAGALSLFVYCCNALIEEGYDYVINIEADDWLINSRILDRIKEFGKKDIQIITEVKYNGVVYPEAVIYKNIPLSFWDINTVFKKYEHNAERTLDKFMKQYNMRLYPRQNKFGYFPPFGMFHSDSYRYKRNHYRRVYNEDTNSIIFDRDPEKEWILG